MADLPSYLHLTLHELHLITRYLIDHRIEFPAHPSEKTEGVSMMPTNCENALSNIPGSTADLQLNQFTTFEIRSTSDHKAVVVGLYGVPGSGKTFLLNQLKQELGQTHFAFYEGSKMIVVPGGLDAFQSMEEQ